MLPDWAAVHAVGSVEEPVVVVEAGVGAFPVVLVLAAAFPVVEVLEAGLVPEVLEAGLVPVVDVEATAPVLTAAPVKRAGPGMG